MFNIQSLKKMATKRIYKMFNNYFGYSLIDVDKDDLEFNPYVLDGFREMMIAMLVGNESPEISINVETYESAPVNEAGFGYVFKASPLIEKIGNAIRNAGKYEPVRIETKGRKSRFSFSEIMDMLNADVQGVRLTDIAKFYNTSCVVMTQILTGASYQWASGINQESF
jgi:hypothetical protein